MTFALVGIAIGLPEVLIVLAIALLIFGPSKLPVLGESIGKMLKGFKKEMKSLNEDEDDNKAGGKEDDEKPDEIDVTPKKEKKQSAET